MRSSMHRGAEEQANDVGTASDATSVHKRNFESNNITGIVSRDEAALPDVLRTVPLEVVFGLRARPGAMPEMPQPILEDEEVP